ncbi:hypoxanthine phosphoribosyltransferase [Oceanivirga salmonicida]|uniref:hypoxanthine phosphoribosyltransferase n=1 Tax=Oceanivirga salmonicida TaxID=1769291 RepID=UPI000829EF7D|nr:hypoxanthine phosphoribosyltransferase [Oceanivirga salmonicida]
MMKNWEKYITKTLISNEQIQTRVKELGAQITNDLKDDTADLVVVGILKGSVIFMADLVREIKLPLSMDFMEVSSYGDGFENTRDIKIIKDLEHSVRGKNVLVVEDIIDSGLTLKKILQMIGKRGPKNVILCTLLNKKERREADVDVQYIGFDIPDEFVSGYGLDYKQEYRNIPYICVLDINNEEI